MSFPRSVSFVLGVVAILGLRSFGPLWSAGRDPSPPRAIALLGGRILTQAEAGAVEGTLVIRDGKIATVASDEAIPADAERIDVKGMVITPGLIDARSTLWLSPAAAQEGASDGGLNVLDDVDPHSEDWREVVRQGVTAVYVQPAATGILGGRGAVLRVRPAESVEELVVQGDAAAQAALGTAGATPAPAAQQTLAGRLGLDTQPSTPALSSNSLTHYGQYEQLKRALDAARRPADEQKKAAPTNGASGTPSRRDPSRELLGRVLKGEIPFRIEAHREDDVRNALRLADEFKLRIVIDGASNPGAAVADLVSRRVPLVLGPFAELEELPTYRAPEPAAPAGRGRGRRQQPAPMREPPATPSAKQPTERTKALPTDDSRWALGTFSNQPRGSRLLRAHAAAAVAQGIDADQVLRAITRGAAEILGVGDRLGTIACGKQADVAVFAGNPLDPSVPVRLVLSQGRIVYRAEGGLATSSPANPQSAAPALPSRMPTRYALRSQRIVTEDGSFRPGVVVVDNGKVAAVGSAATPDGVSVIDLGNAVLAPGLVGGPGELGLGGAIDDPAEADAGQIRAADVFDPQHRAVRKLLEGGFTTLLFAPGSVNVLAGACSGLRLGAADPTFVPGGMKFVLAATSRGAGRTASPAAEDGLPAFLQAARGGPPRYPASLAGQVELIEQVLSGKAAPTELYVPAGIRQQIQAERRRNVAGLLEKKQVAYFEVRSRAETDAALRLVKRFGLRAVLVGPEEVRPFLEPIKRLGVGVAARPVQAGDYDRPLQELAAATVAGVPVAFTGSAQEMRMAAALAVNAGLPQEAAWRGLTTGAAALMGLPEGTGRVVVGGNADLGIWTGMPIDLCSRPVQVLVAGKVPASAP